MYRLVLSEQASRFYKRCDRPLAKKLARCFTALEHDPRSGNNVKVLKGPYGGSYRYRVGDFRVIYTINEQTVTVFVVTIAHRKDIYD